ncbi:MAG: DUF167 domain-containing protein [Acidobacteria bacterium]|nr:DUF167 domain-containing protein [Acidobacteriota bacterium]
MVVAVKVAARSSQSAVVGTMPDGSLKVKVMAPPEDGKANEEVCQVLAAYYKVKRGDVEVIAGQTSTRKLVRVKD